jgi:hypothetical protein
MRLLTGGSLLAFLIAAIVVLSGQTNQAHDLLGSDPAAALVNKPSSAIGEAQSIGQEQALAGYLQELQGDLLDPDQVPTDAELTATLRANEPQAKIGKSIEQGGVVVARSADEQTVGVCSMSADKQIFCAATNLRTHAVSKGAGETVPAAMAEAAAR